MIIPIPCNVGGRADTVAENNHIYKDSTGFEYDITVTKVDILMNSNERQSITVSNLPSISHQTHS